MCFSASASFGVSAILLAGGIGSIKNVKTTAPKAVEIAPSAPANNTKKLGFKEKKEFDTLEKEIATLNKDKEQLTSKISDPALPFDQIQAVSARIGAITAMVDEKELRWLEISEMMA